MLHFFHGWKNLTNLSGHRPRQGSWHLLWFTGSTATSRSTLHLEAVFFSGGRRLGASGMVPSHSPHWITEFCPPKFQGWEWMKCWKKNTLTSLLSSKSWGIFSALRPRSYCFSKVSSSYRPRRLQNDTKEDWKNACKSNITCQNAISVTSGFAPGPWNTWSEV